MSAGAIERERRGGGGRLVRLLAAAAPALLGSTIPASAASAAPGSGEFPRGFRSQRGGRIGGFWDVFGLA
jgi:hypothetical protein